MSTIKPNDRLDVIAILNLSEIEAATWLEQQPISEPSFWDSSEQRLLKVASFVFARRDSKRLRLAVARHGSHILTLRRLYSEGSNAERLGVLSNRNVGPISGSLRFGQSEKVLTDEEARAILKDRRSRAREFEVLFSNPHIDRRWLSEVLDKWNEIEGLADLDLLALVRCLSTNPIISVQYDDTFLDGFAEYKHQKLNFALANLLQTVPVTRWWADALGRLLDNLYLPFTPDYGVDLLARWRLRDSAEENEEYEFLYLRQQIIKYLVVRDHRPEAKEKYTINHSDPAVRKGLYLSLTPRDLFQGLTYGRNFQYPSFRHLRDMELSEAQQRVADICHQCFDQDQNEFVEALIWNAKFWERKDERDLLSDLAWNLAEDKYSSMDVPNLYRSREAFHLENNPNFFKDDEWADIPFDDSVDGKLSRLQSDLEALGDAIQALSPEDLVSQQHTEVESIESDLQYQLHRLSDQISKKSDELVQRVEQGSLTQQIDALERRIRWQGILICLLTIAAILVLVFK